MIMAKVVFVSAFISPHIKPFCDILHQHYKDAFIYIQMQRLTKERQALGYAYDKSDIPYVMDLTDNLVEQKRIVDGADCVIINSGTTNPILVEDRIRSNKLTFFANERLLKRGLLKFLDKRLWTQWRINLLGRNKNLYLLCFGAFVKHDFELIGFHKNRSFKFGYFPELSIVQTAEKDERNAIGIVWVGRMIDWKRPVFALKVAKELQKQGMPYRIEMIGDGPYFEVAKNYAAKHKLNAVFCGSLPNNEVRKAMARADVFFSTSNRREGWGAVVNEALSVGTPVVASRDIGCVPYLINNGENGFGYHTHNAREAAECIVRTWKMDRTNVSQKITKTLTKWNPKIAGERLCVIIDRIMCCEPVLDLFKDGPMSKA